MFRARSAAILAIAFALAPRALAGQFRLWQPLVAIGDAADDRVRLSQITSGSASGAYLLRSASVLTPALPGDSARLRWARRP